MNNSNGNDRLPEDFERRVQRGAQAKLMGVGFPAGFGAGMSGEVLGLVSAAAEITMALNPATHAECVDNKPRLVTLGTSVTPIECNGATGGKGSYG